MELRLNLKKNFKNSWLILFILSLIAIKFNEFLANTLIFVSVTLFLISAALQSSRNIICLFFQLLLVPPILSLTVGTYLFYTFPNILPPETNTLIYFIFSIPITTIIIAILCYWKVDGFVQRSKVVNEVINAILFILLAVTLIYAYSITDFSAYFKGTSLSELKEFGLGEREAFLFGVQYILYPLLPKFGDINFQSLL